MRVATIMVLQRTIKEISNVQVMDKPAVQEISSLAFIFRSEENFTDQAANSINQKLNTFSKVILFVVSHHAMIPIITIEQLS